MLGDMKGFFTTLITIALSASMFAAVNKQNFDFVVGVDGTWAQAKAAAESSSKPRFYIFLPDGQYDFGRMTGDSNQKTTFSRANVSIVGQSMNGVVCYNAPSSEGIGTTATIFFKNGGIYMQDITLKNNGYVNMNASANRLVCLQDEGNKNIYKNVKMLSGQDTYYTTKAARRTYLEGCEIHGTVDFICGGGQVYFNKCLIYCENRANDVITAPGGNGEQFGYVFESCTIDGAISDGSFTLGRAWQQKPRAVFLNTTMKKKPSAAGWGNPMNTCPALFAEYNSKDIWGNPVDLSQRRSFYQCSKDGSTAQFNPVLNGWEASQYTIKNVLGSDGWAPDVEAATISARQLSANGNKLSWNDDENALCYFIFCDGKYVANTTQSSYTMNNGNTNSIYTVRAANGMGGLGASSNGVKLTGEIIPDDSIVDPDPEPSENEHVFHFDNGMTSMREGTDKENVWTCSDNGYTDYKWEISSRDDKAVLYGNNVTYRGNSYKTFKGSNGAQAKLTMPDGVAAKKITFIGYTNDAELLSVLSEINGDSTVNITFDKNTSNYASSPAKITYEFSEPVCKDFTFTFSVKQACFIIALDSEECGCEKKQDDNQELDDPTSVELTISDEMEDSEYFDLYGRKISQPTAGKVYIHAGKKVLIR